MSCLLPLGWSRVLLFNQSVSQSWINNDVWNRESRKSNLLMDRLLKFWKVATHTGSLPVPGTVVYCRSFRFVVMEKIPPSVVLSGSLSCVLPRLLWYDQQAIYYFSILPLGSTPSSLCLCANPASRRSIIWTSNKFRRPIRSIPSISILDGGLLYFCTVM